MSGKKKVYLAGPMTDVSDWNTNAFMRAEFFMETRGWVVLNPARRPVRVPQSLSHEDYLKLSKTLIDISDSILLLPGWWRSEGALHEAKYALSVGKETLIYKRELEI